MIQLRADKIWAGASVVFIFVLLFPGRAFPDLDEQITDNYPAAEDSAVKIVQESRNKERLVDDLGVNIFLDIQQGYDNNVDLDSKRHKDGFLQSSASVDISYKEIDKIKLKAGTDIFSIAYYNRNINNLFNLSPYIGFDWTILPGLVSRNRLTYDYFSYPNDKESTYNGLNMSTFLRHFVLDNFYQEIGFETIMRWYPDRKIYTSSGWPDSKDRADDRYRIKYNIGYYSERFFLRVSNEMRRADSNDMYQDYYDYWMYRLRPSLMYFFTEKLYTDISFLYKYTKYDDRRSTESNEVREKDHTYMLSAALYYDINRNLTLGFTYSYTENRSNDPFQKYSGSVVSGGIYYNF